VKIIITKIIIFLSVLVLSCSIEETQPPQVTSQDTPDQILENSTIVLTVSGIKSTVIKANYLIKYEKKDITLARVIQADFFDKEGKHTSILTADSGFIHEQRQDMEVLGNVLVVTDDGLKLETTSLRWDPKINKIVTDAFVKITQKNDIITGYGLETDSELKNIKVKKNVKGQLEELTTEQER